MRSSTRRSRPLQPVVNVLPPVLQPVIHTVAPVLRPAAAIVRPLLPSAPLTPPAIPVLETAPRGPSATAVAHVIAPGRASRGRHDCRLRAALHGGGRELPVAAGTEHLDPGAAGGAVPGTAHVVPFARPAPARGREDWDAHPGEAWQSSWLSPLWLPFVADGSGSRPASDDRSSSRP